MKQFSWIDGLKGIAILAVIIVHCDGGKLPSPYGDFGKIGANGVQLFFVISGFLCALSVDRYFNKHPVSVKAAWSWTVNKCIRLIPLYYLSLIIGIMTGGSELWLAGRNISAGNIITHLFFLHGLFPVYNDSILAVEWYISVLVMFYFLCPYIYKYIFNAKRCIAVTIVISLLSCWGCSSIAEKYRNTQDAFIYVNYFERFSIYSQLPVLLMGVIVYFAFKKYVRDSSPESKWLSYSLLLFVGFMLYGQAFRINKIHWAYDTTLFGVWFSILFLSQMVHPVIAIDNPVFCFLGRYSFQLYLFHHHILNFYRSRIHIETGSVTLNMLAQFAFVLSFSIIVSLLLSRFFERPVLGKLRLFFEKGS